ncbi:hypothetical protein [Nostoc sp.]|uniref:hypothetical protein n=1 Tax=Nostoc sp. TaxID=1180 RepID=UPI002FF59F9C
MHEATGYLGDRDQTRSVGWEEMPITKIECWNSWMNVRILTASPECDTLTDEAWLMLFCHLPL